MKKLMFNLLMLICPMLIVPAEITAQIDQVPDKKGKEFWIGLNFGRMVSDIKASPYLQPISKNYLSSSTFGLSAGLYLNKFLALNVAMQYERKGVRFPEDKNYIHLISSDDKTFSLHYLTIRQAILFTTQGKTAVFFGPGIYQAVILHVHHGFFPPDLGTTSFDFGADLHTGISRPLTQRLRAQLEITASMGLASIHEKESEKWFPPAINRSIASRIAFTYSLQ